MVLAFAVIGAMVAQTVEWRRVGAIVVIYFLGLGIAAHALDALGSKKAKPWGDVFTTSQLWLLAAVSLAAAYAIAVYCMIRYAPWLWTVAVLEGFFVFAYNLEWFEGWFHTDGWFAFSWGFLPVVAGHLIQANTVSFDALVLAAAMALFSLVEIKASRHYKALKQMTRIPEGHEKTALEKYEAILKSVSAGVILLATGLLIHRMAG
jgi:xanthine/uracil permease